MSQEINNREYRQAVIKDLLAQLHAGKSVDQVKEQFAEAFDGVSAAEIAEAEQALIAGGLPVEEVQRLCDVHAAVFKGSIEEIHQPLDFSETPGHPAHTLREENRALERLVQDRLRPDLAALAGGDTAAAGRLRQGFAELAQIGLHYSKKENLFFPYMERYGITAPPKVMWGVDDEIRALIKETRALLEQGADPGQIPEKAEEALSKTQEMIFKEENILLPMLMETLTQEEWKRIADESGEIGYCLIPDPPVWNPQKGQKARVEAQEAPAAGGIALPTGNLTVLELTRLLDTLPMDITFVDKEDTVKYFSQGTERIFPRTKAVLGRKVANCHPPASVHIVEGIVEDLRSGRKDHEDFWIRMGGKYILIRYYAVRGENGEYLGTLEVTQDIAPIQQIDGEKRLVTET